MKNSKTHTINIDVGLNGNDHLKKIAHTIPPYGRVVRMCFYPTQSLPTTSSVSLGVLTNNDDELVSPVDIRDYLQRQGGDYFTSKKPVSLQGNYSYNIVIQKPFGESSDVHLKGQILFIFE